MIELFEINSTLYILEAYFILSFCYWNYYFQNPIVVLTFRDDSIPSSVRTANIQNDPLEETDKIALILCPQYSESGMKVQAFKIIQITKYLFLS